MELTTEDIVSIREEYKNTLELPISINSELHQFFLCPVGLVGAGKSTVLKPLSKKLSLVRISSDDVRQILHQRGAGYSHLLDIVKPLVEELATQGYSLAFDADCGNPITQDLINKLAEKTKAMVYWIHINPPEDFILNKLKKYNHTWLFKDSEQAIENYFKQKNKREEENNQFNFLATIDTSRSDLSVQIENTFELIRRNLK
jgi:predicted kinase